MIADVYRDNDAMGLSELVRTKQISASELVEEAIRRIETMNPRLNAIVYKAYDYARKRAKETLPGGPLAGVPFAIKDLFTQFEDFPVTNGSRLFKDYVGSTNWELANRMKAAGLIAVGKTNVPEMGACPSTEPAFHGPTINPWNAGIVPGGSSGGSAVAVAAGMVPIADAGDGGGSIRIPSSVNGLVGLKPTRGRTTFAPAAADIWYGAAVVGCVSRSVRDTAAYLDATGGALPGEPYGLPMPEKPYLSLVGAPVRRLRIGFVTTEPDGSPLNREVRDAVVKATALCEKVGHDVGEKVFRYDVEVMNRTFRRVTAVLSAAFFDSCPDLLGREVTPADVEPMTWAIRQFGKSLTAAQHAADIEKLRAIGCRIVQDLHDLDVLITPTLPTPPRPAGWFDMSKSDVAEYDAKIIPNGIFTRPFSVSGQPAISLPLHFSTEGHPVGVQFVARIGDEATLISLASQLEVAQPWADRRPNV